MQIVKSPNLHTLLKNKFLFIDTNVFVGMLKYPELFGSFFEELSQLGCSFLTIPQVVFEFSKGTSTVIDYKNRLEFFADNGISLYPIDRHLSRNTDFQFILQKSSKALSYTDFLLCLCLHVFPQAFLISEDRDISVDIFDRNHLITVDTEKDIRTYGIYSSSNSKLDKYTKLLL